MAGSWEEQIGSHFCKVVDNLRLPRLLDSLLARRLLTFEEYNHLRDPLHGTEEERSRILLSKTLRKKGTRAYEVFCEALLAEPSQAFIATDILGYERLPTEHSVGVANADPARADEKASSSEAEKSVVCANPWCILEDSEVAFMLSAKLSFRPNFVAGLKESKIISSEHYKEMKDGQKPRDCKLILLLSEILPMCTPNQFPVFCEVLRKTNKKMISVADKLIEVASSRGWSASGNGTNLSAAAMSTQKDRLESLQLAIPVAGVSATVTANPSKAQHGITRRSNAERTVFVTVHSNYKAQYKRLHREVRCMIKQTIHPIDEAWRPLRVEVIAMDDEDEDEQCREGPEFQEKMPVKFAFPRVDYEQGAEKRDLLVELLTRNITELSKDEIRFVGDYPNGLVYVITIPGNAALCLLCLLKGPLPHWPYVSFGPVKVHFYGLPSIEMKFQVSDSCKILRQQVDRCFHRVDSIDDTLQIRKQQAGLIKVKMQCQKEMNKQRSEAAKSSFVVSLTVAVDPMVASYARTNLKSMITSLCVESLLKTSQHLSGMMQSLRERLNKLEEASSHCQQLLEDVASRADGLMLLGKEQPDHESKSDPPEGELEKSILLQEDKEQPDQKSGPPGNSTAYWSPLQGPPPFPHQISPVSSCMGRDGELSIIQTYYDVNTTPDSNNPIIQIIVAGAGMGKTYTAFEYARQNKKLYPDGTFYFSLESRLTFSQSIKENLVSVRLRPSGNPIEDFIRLQIYVQRHPHCLFLYDNADDLSILEDYLPAAPLHILVTTRRRSSYSLRLQHAHTLLLKPLQANMAVQLLLTLCRHPLSLQQLQQDYPSEYKHALNVVGPEILDGLPLGVVHAASLISKQLAHKTERLKEVSEMLEKNRGHLSMEPRSVEEWLRNYHLSGIHSRLENELNVSSLDDIRSLTERTIEESSLKYWERQSLRNAKDDLLNYPSIGPWKIDIDSVCKANKVCKSLLQAASLLPSRDIPISLLSSHLQTVCEGTDDQQFSVALQLMEERSLLSSSEDGQTVTLHPLLQQTIQQYVVDRNNERESILSFLSATFIQLFPSLEKIQTKDKLTDINVMKYASHLYHIASLTLDCCCESPATRSVVDLACELSLQMENRSVADPLCYSRLTSARRCGNKQCLVQALVDAARVLAMQHQSSKAHILCQSAIQLLSDGPSACGHTTEQWALLMVNIAGAYWELRQFAEIASIATEAKHTLEAGELTNCYVFAQCLNLLALCHSANGDFVDAENVSRAALSVYIRCVSEDHPAVGRELSNLGGYCVDRSKFEEAESFLQKSLHVRRNSLPAQHPDIVCSLRMMGELYNKWGQYEKAEECLREALDIIEFSCLSRHVEAALVTSQMGRCYGNQEYYNLGQFLYRQKKYRDAQAAFHTALDIETNTLGRDHPDTAWTLHALSLCYQATGNHQQALPLLQEAVEITKKKYGDSHKATQTMVTALQSLKRELFSSS